MDAEKHFINDPIHGVIHLTPDEKDFLKPIIDSTAFQRLKGIKQLGLTDMIFPSAVHTRFSHSVGVCYLAKKLALLLELDETAKKEIMLTALLHDIGHGCFSHFFEHLFPAQNIKHDKEILEIFLDNFIAESAAYPTDRHDYHYFFQKAKTILLHPEQLPADEYYKREMISSQLDVDRLDYLLRDSHFCGVPYGKFDLSWILNSIKLHAVDGKMRIVVSEKCIGTLEHYLMARRLMTKHVYLHTKTRACEVYLQAFLTSLMTNLTAFNGISPPLLAFLQALSHSNAQSPTTFLDTIMDSYSQLVDADIWLTLRNIHQQDPTSECHLLADKILARKFPRIIKIKRDKYPEAAAIIADFKQNHPYKPWQITLDKLSITTYKKANPILTLTRGSQPVDLSQYSTLIGLISENDEASYRLYVDKDILPDAAIQAFSDTLFNADCTEFKLCG